MLGGIESSIGKFNQVALELGISIIYGNANADCEMLNGMRRAGKKFCLFHGPPEPLGHIEGSRFSGFREDNDELFSTIARYRIHFTHVFHQNGGYVTQ